MLSSSRLDRLERVIAKRSGRARSYEAYAKRLLADIDRIRDDWSHGQQKFALMLIVAGAVVLLLFVAVRSGGVLTILPYWTGPALFGVIGFALIVMLGSMWRRTTLGLVRLCFGKTTIDCPHCTRNIDLTRVWQCGWCGILNNRNMLLSPNLVFDGCCHRGHHVPAAIRCSECGLDVIRDHAAYVRERRANYTSETGVAVFLDKVASAQVVHRQRASGEPPPS